MFALWFSVLCVLLNPVFAQRPAHWRDRAIYQVVTDRFARTDGNTSAICNTDDRVYCGGTWKGLIQKLGYIKGMGFTAVWISPVTYQLQGNTAWGEAYAGYWQQDLYRVNEHFGTAADLKALSAALHSHGMYLMVDVVVNHNAWNGPPSSVNYSAFNPFNNPCDYHKFCEVNYADTTSVQNCWLGDTKLPLPDLKTESSTVASGYQTWINQLMTNYSIDGLRLDTVIQVDRSFWSPFSQAAGNRYMVGEVFDGSVNTLCAYQKLLPGILNFPTYFAITAAFQSPTGDMGSLVSTLSAVKSTCRDPSLLGTFSENADLPRFAQLNGDLAAAQNVLAFTLLADGIPILYQGQEQHYKSIGGSGDPYNREALWLSGFNTKAPLYGLVRTLLTLRKWASHLGKEDRGYHTYNAWPIYSDAHTVVLRKGHKGQQVLTVLTNVGSAGSQYTVDLGWRDISGMAGQMWVDVLCCAEVMVDARGNLKVSLSQGLPRVLFPKLELTGSGLCGH